MINIRLALNERPRRFGGNIGFSIRPSERGKGCNKINLYPGLKVCAEHGIKSVLPDADPEDPASRRTIGPGRGEDPAVPRRRLRPPHRGG